MTPEGFTFVNQRQCLVMHTGHQGILFGGMMLSWLDEAGALFAEEASRAAKLVTRALDAMEFINPVYPSENVRFYAKVDRRGTTSVTVRIQAFVHDPRARRAPKPVTEACMTFVSVNEEGGKCPIDWDSITD
jgi:acyl-CoA thioesterase YciA